jgi:hypothetical protein
MPDITQDHRDDDSYSRHLFDDADAAPDPRDALRAHLIGLCSGALIILGTTAAVCTVMHWL